MMLVSSSLDSAGANTPVEKKAETVAPAKPASKAKSKPFRGKLKVVDYKAKVIVLEGAKAQTFQITSETRINKDDKPAALSELNVGEAVTGYARETPDGKWEARSLYAGKRSSKPKN